MTGHDQFTLPSAIQAEQSVLGALLLDNDAIDRMGRLKAEDFYRADHRQLFEAITSLIAENSPADVVTVFDRLQARGAGADALVYLNKLAQETPSAANIGRYAESVRQASLKRGLLQGASQVQDIVVGGEGDAGEMLEASQAVFAKLADQTTHREPAAVSEIMSRYIEDLDARIHGEKPKAGMATGLTDLDKILNGGLHRGKLYIVGARPAMGKTALAMTIACNMAKAGRSALVLSMEMPDTEVIERAIGVWGEVSGTDLSMACGDLSDSQWKAVTKAATIAGEANLYIDDEPALSLLDVTTKARAVKRKRGLDILVVDYLQLMTGPEQRRIEQIENITKGLKVLAKTLNVAVVALSQLSRKVEERTDKRPLLSDLRESGSIEQDADVVLMLYREEQDRPETEWKGMGEVFVRKHRGGKTGEVRLTYQGEFTRFVNYSGPVVASYAERKQTGSKRRGFEG